MIYLLMVKKKMGTFFFIWIYDWKKDQIFFFNVVF